MKQVVLLLSAVCNVIIATEPHEKIRSLSREVTNEKIAHRLEVLVTSTKEIQGINKEIDNIRELLNGEDIVAVDREIQGVEDGLTTIEELLQHEADRLEGGGADSPQCSGASCSLCFSIKRLPSFCLELVLSPHGKASSHFKITMAGRTLLKKEVAAASSSPACLSTPLPLTAFCAQLRLDNTREICLSVFFKLAFKNLGPPEKCIKLRGGR